MNGKSALPHYYCGEDKRTYPTNETRLQELHDAGYDCSLVTSVIIKKADVKAGLILNRKEVRDIMGGKTSPTWFNKDNQSFLYTGLLCNIIKTE